VRSTRDYLVHLLTEAAEIEHNILCTYLFAAFSLKEAGDGLGDVETEAVTRWRKTITGIAVQEMAHLALVNNFLVAIGGAPHFDRPNLPVPPGYHPAGFVMRLAPLSKEVLDHFIHQERPADVDAPEGDGFVAPALARTPTAGSLVPSTPDYDTIGEFYAEIRAATARHAADGGPRAFLDPTGAAQLDQDCARLEGLHAIRNAADAMAALDTIVEQGEGAKAAAEQSHFAKFEAMREEWRAFEAADAAFDPVLPVAADPVMRRPEEGVPRTWIVEPTAARLLDLGNAVYGAMLTLLEQAYAPGLTRAGRGAVTRAAMASMGALSTVATALARCPAAPGSPQTAGLSFAVPRNLGGRLCGAQLPILEERLNFLAYACADLGHRDAEAALRRALAALAAAK
jgi:hypothetical protein